MEHSDYVYSLKALDFWLDDLEKRYKESEDPNVGKMLLQIDRSFQNIFQLFKEEYDNAESEEVLRRATAAKNTVAASLKREVKLPLELVQTIKYLVDTHNYKILSDVSIGLDSDKLFLNYSEAEALISLAVIEHKKASLMYPKHDRGTTEYCELDEIMYSNVKRGFYKKIIDYVTEAFSDQSFDHLL